MDTSSIVSNPQESTANRVAVHDLLGVQMSASTTQRLKQNRRDSEHANAASQSQAIAMIHKNELLRKHAC